MSALDEAAIVLPMQAQQAELCKRIHRADVHYLDLGLEYHAMPLELRNRTPASNFHIDCRTAFLVPEDSDTDIVGYLHDLRHLCLAAEHHLAQADLEAARLTLEIMTDLSSALQEQIVAVEKGVDELHMRFSDMLDEGFEFADGGVYRLAYAKEEGSEKHETLKMWLLSLPHVREWLESGDVASEEEALILAVAAGLESEKRFSAHGMRPHRSEVARKDDNGSWLKRRMDGDVSNA